jgi:mono/diheme cytochrome c family protein
MVCVSQWRSYLSGLRFVSLACLAVLLASSHASLIAQQGNASSPLAARQFVDRYCVSCHNDRLKTGGLSLAQADAAKPGTNAELWEKVVRKLRTGVMPPPNMPQPSAQDRGAILQRLESSLDAAYTAKPNPGRTETLRRLNRTEYQNAIRDLLALEIDAASLLPSDESGHGFDNVIVGDLPATLLNRYIAAAQKVSRLAIGSGPAAVQGETINVPGDLTQEDRLPGMPMGTRGGVSTRYTFPQDGEYDIQVVLARNLENIVSGLREARPHQLVILIDREPVKTFTVQRIRNADDTQADKDLKARLTVKAGPHDVAVTFIKEGSSLSDAVRQPPASRYNDRRYPRTAPAVGQVSITGPYSPGGPGDTPSRRRLLICKPTGSTSIEEEKCASDILSTVMRRAYRRAVVKSDLEQPMSFYRKSRGGADFDTAIASALTAVLVNPDFLLRVESDPKRATTNVYRISDLELASRLSFFLWSSIPDDELLEVAIRGKLSQPAELETQTRRMLADPRSSNLATNFAGQWLRLRNIDSLMPSTTLFRDFDDNLRQAFRQETEMFFDSIVREDRSALTFIRSDYTFLNERLAVHYGIPNVYGSRFRRVALAPDSNRGGLLRQGSLLSVTSYATRTSPVLRGVLVLRNIMGAPPPSPPPNVPALDESTMSSNLSMRDRLALHRNNAVCASCHRSIDPVGFALENFNAVGQWRDFEADGSPVDATGAIPGGSEFRGVKGLEDAILAQPDLFVTALTENLMTFGLGRGVEYYDAPAVRKIVMGSEKTGYRFSSLILGIVQSVPFQMRRAENKEEQSARLASNK